jgi:hypothetical protein
MKKIIILGLIVAPLTVAIAAPQPAILAQWVVQPSDAPLANERLVMDGNTVVRNRLLPTALAVLKADSISETPKSLSVLAGTQLYSVANSPGLAVYCAFESKMRGKDNTLNENRKEITLCFIDGDGNGKFESKFGVAAGVGLPMVQGNIPKAKGLMPVDLAYEVRPTSEFKGDLWVALKYEEYFNIYGNRMIMVAFGSRGNEQTLTDFATFKAKGPFPQVVESLGAKITVLSVEAKGSRLRIDRPISIPVFGVYSSTTYTIY